MARQHLVRRHLKQRRLGAPPFVASNKKVGSRPLVHATCLEATQYNFYDAKRQGQPPPSEWPQWGPNQQGDPGKEKAPGFALEAFWVPGPCSVPRSDGLTTAAAFAAWALARAVAAVREAVSLSRTLPDRFGHTGG
jgi:hypothetical protein